MAHRKITIIVDDLDGSQPATTVRFSYQGAEHALDLSPANKQRLADALAPFIAAGRPLGAHLAHARLSTGRAKPRQA